jgi:hypothetical protein
MLSSEDFGKFVGTYWRKENSLTGKNSAKAFRVDAEIVDG